MKLGIGSYTYTWAVGVPGYTPDRPMSALDLLEKAFELRVDVVQYCDNLPLAALSEHELSALTGQAAKYGISIEVGTRGIGRENIAAHLELAKRLNAPFVRFVIDGPGDEPSPDEVIARVSPFMPAFAEANIVFAIENHDRFPVSELLRIVETLGPSHTGICLDTVNSLGSLETPRYVVSSLAPYTINLHVKDFQIKRVPSQMGFNVMGCAAGTGRLDIPWVLDRLACAGREVNSIVELWTPRDESLQSTLEREDRWAKESVQFMRQLIPCANDVQISFRKYIYVKN